MATRYPENSTTAPTENSPKATRHVTGYAGSASTGFFVSQFRLGFRLARDRKNDEVEPAAIEQLKSAVTAAAQLETAAVYDAKNNASDGLREAQYQRKIKRRAEVEEEVKHARVEHREARKHLAALGERPVAPKTPLLLGIIAAFGMSLSVAATAHDVILARLVHPRLLALLVSECVGLVLAGVAVAFILASARQAWTSTLNIASIAAGVGFAVALLLLRAGSGVTSAEFMLGVGFALIELACLAFLEIRAHGLRHAWQEYGMRQMSFAEAERKLRAAEDDLNERLAEQAELTAHIDEHIAMVEERDHRRLSTPYVTEASTRAASLGYHHGVEANRLAMRGVPLTAPGDDEILAMLGMTSKPS